MRVKEPVDELFEFQRKSAILFEEVLNEIAEAIFLMQDKTNLEFWLADLIAGTMAYADMLGRRRLIMQFNNLLGRHFYAEPINPIPQVPKAPSFQDAISDLLNKYPYLAKDYKEVSALYSREKAFALAKSTSAIITQRVQKAIAKGLEEGKPLRETRDVIAKIGNFTKSYSENIYRTNLNTSYTAGLFRKAQDPEIKEITPAFRYSAILDKDVRPNHKAMHGVVASVDDEIWNTLAPPLGYNCRCSLSLVDKFTLKREGLLTKDGRLYKARVPRGAFPDKGFKVYSMRPDKFVGY